jgi:hypothetical protein
MENQPNEMTYITAGVLDALPGDYRKDYFVRLIAEVQNTQIGLSPTVAACLPALRKSVLALANKILC